MRHLKIRLHTTFFLPRKQLFSTIRWLLEGKGKQIGRFTDVSFDAIHVFFFDQGPGGLRWCGTRRQVGISAIFQFTETWPNPSSTQSITWLLLLMVQKSHSQPPGMYKTLKTNGILYLPYQLVQDFFHEPYLFVVRIVKYSTWPRNHGSIGHLWLSKYYSCPLQLDPCSLTWKFKISPLEGEISFGSHNFQFPW